MTEPIEKDPQMDVWQEFDHSAVRNLKSTLIERYKTIYEQQRQADSLGFSDEDGKFCHGAHNSDASYSGSLMLSHGGFDYRIAIESPEWPTQHRVDDTTVKVFPQFGQEDGAINTAGVVDEQLYAVNPLFWEHLITTGEPVRHRFIAC